MKILEKIYWKIKNFLYDFIKIQTKIILKKLQFRSENKDKKFEIIYRADPCTGIFSNIAVFLYHINHAYEVGRIPVIDMQFFDNILVEREEFNRINYWEYFFEQPGGYLLKEAYKSKNLYFCDGKSSNTIEDTDVCKEVYKKSIKLNATTSEYINNEWNKLINSEDRVLGVLCRGTDYLLEENGYNVIDLKSFLKIITEKKEKYSCNKIFLVTEDASILTAFNQAFPSDLVFLDDVRTTMNAGQIFLRDRWNEMNIDKKMKNLRYISAIYMLSRCNCFVANVNTSAVPFVEIIRGTQFEDLYICSQ